MFNCIAVLVQNAGQNDGIGNEPKRVDDWLGLGIGDRVKEERAADQPNGERSGEIEERGKTCLR
jgi:hypothetical protein